MFGYFSRKINVIQTRGISTILHDFIYSLLLCSAACTQLQRYSRTLHFAPVFTLPVLSGNFSATFFLSCSTVIFIIFSSVSQRSIIFISPSIPKTLTWQTSPMVCVFCGVFFGRGQNESCVLNSEQQLKLFLLFTRHQMGFSFAFHQNHVKYDFQFVIMLDNGQARSVCFYSVCFIDIEINIESLLDQHN